MNKKEGVGRNPQIRSLLASVSKRAKRLERVGRSKLCKRIHTHRCSQKNGFQVEGDHCHHVIDIDVFTAHFLFEEK